MRNTTLVRELLRPIPGLQAVSRSLSRRAFGGSCKFWEERYANGGTSGPGSYGSLAQAKAEFLNTFVREHGVRSVTEFGCGDGHQLASAHYPSYVGLDVSSAAVRICKRRFADDPSKSFFLYDGECFADPVGVFRADLVLSLDVIYHLVENEIFETHMRHIFDSASRYVVVYSTNSELIDGAPHVRHRAFTPWVEANAPEWRLARTVRGPNTESRRADFFVFELTGGQGGTGERGGHRWLRA